jgi:hypothetical protein
MNPPPPRHPGPAARIRKPTCHITVRLAPLDGAPVPAPARPPKVEESEAEEPKAEAAEPKKKPAPRKKATPKKKTEEASS